MMYKTVKLGELLELLTDYHANGAYEKLKENVELLDEPDYAVMIRTTNFEQNNFSSSLKYINEHAYNFLAKSKVYPNDIIMNKIANAGSSYLMPDLKRPVSLAMNLFLLRVKEDVVNPIYLYMYLKLNETYVKSFANGSVTKTITKDAVRNLEIKLPTREVQDKIASIYLTISRKIEINQNINETLEKLSYTLFKSWFVDFDPVIDNALEVGNSIPDEFLERAKQRKAVKKKEKGVIRTLFPNDFEFTEKMGWIPKGWRIKSFSELATLDTSSIKPNLNPEKIWEHFSIPAFDSNKSPIFELGESIKSNKYKVDANSILVSKLNPENERVWWVDIKDKNSAICSTEFMQFIPIKPKHRAFIYSLLRSDYVQTEILSYVTGSTGSHQRTQPKSVAVVDVLIPDEKLVVEFSELAYKWKSKVSDNIKLDFTLARLREVLLPKLMSGEIGISEATALVENA
ncbi:restriction endonuclease subunit S [Acinetobacter bohemicus]|uniref:restriction endonuclease subunit S n=1 Tax=Acinetobacter TaxID=469 RepID=UPI00209AF104|nr:restriction endonuclease subunit S [Acinetobacter sp. S4397-1]EJB8376132.1 restriction endonuclease subunit S [Acinetobacter baumannii]MCO8045537.1 restriction endonuclease subunit S [Acinetobacter sp. S4397-1]